MFAGRIPATTSLHVLAEYTFARRETQVRGQGTQFQLLHSLDCNRTLVPFCRDFVLSQYQHLKKANPKFPILIRECSGAEARLIARYGEILALINMPVLIGSISANICFCADFGVEQSVSINGLDSNAISSKLEDLVKKGESMPRCWICQALYPKSFLLSCKQQYEC